MLYQIVDGRISLPATVHHLPHLLDLSAEEVLASFRTGQIQDFDHVLEGMMDRESGIGRLFHELTSLFPQNTGSDRVLLLQPEGIRSLFLDLHSHVMAHPVWSHPFFVRFFAGEFTREQLELFAVHYFNQIKNTRQCVAMAIGRFHGLMSMDHGVVSERVSELTQIVLAQLVADEYGIGAHDLEDYPGLEEVLRARTHIGMYRQLLDGLEITFAEQDVPMFPGVADNVLIQRMVASSPAFTPLEALSSVGLGMEWGVPEFFSLLLGGLIRFTARTNLPLTAHHVEVLTAHVGLDVLHAVSVMAVTALFVHDTRDVEDVKQAVNALMAGRYAMMSDLQGRVFGNPGPNLAEVGLAPRYHLRDSRYADELLRARKAVAPERVIGHGSWLNGPAPFPMR